MKSIHLRLIKLLFLVIFFKASQAQMYNSNLVLMKPSAYLSEWNSPATGRLIVINPNLQSFAQVKIYFELKDDQGQVLIQSNLLTLEPHVLNGGVNTFSIAQFFSMENAIIHSNAQKMLVSTAKLKAGIYQLSVQLYKDSLGIYVPASFMQNKMFTIQSYQLPILTAPLNDQVLDAAISKSFIIFRWTALLPSGFERVKYVLKITEVLDNQTPYQALQTNPVIFEKEIANITQYIWQPMLNFSDTTTKKFIWTIQTLDSQGNQIEGTNPSATSLAEPSVFYIKSTIKVAVKEE